MFTLVCTCRSPSHRICDRLVLPVLAAATSSDHAQGEPTRPACGRPTCALPQLPSVLGAARRGDKTLLPCVALPPHLHASSLCHTLAHACPQLSQPGRSARSASQLRITARSPSIAQARARLPQQQPHPVVPQVVSAGWALPAVLACRALVGLGEGVVMPAMNTIMATRVPAAWRSSALGVVYSGFHAGRQLQSRAWQARPPQPPSQSGYLDGHRAVQAAACSDPVAWGWAWSVGVCWDGAVACLTSQSDRCGHASSAAVLQPLCWPGPGRPPGEVHPCRADDEPTSDDCPSMAAPTPPSAAWHPRVKGTRVYQPVGDRLMVPPMGRDA